MLRKTSDILIFCTIWTLPFFAWAQFSQYPFLNLSRNVLEFKGDSAAFMKFYEKLDTLIFTGKGQINIIHFGGSHVQAGTLSNRIRHNFLHLSPDLKHDRGFFFPYRLAGTNNPSDYSVIYDGFWEGCRCALPASNCYWGVSGINASTIDTNAAFTIVARDEDSSSYRFTSVRIFYAMTDTSYALKLVGDYDIEKVRWDSIAQYVEYRFKRPYQTLQCKISQTDSTQRNFILQGVQYVSELPGLTYHAIGVNGAATYSYLRCANFTNQLRSLNPDLVIFGIGINDANRPSYEFSKSVFEENYDSLVARIRSVNPDAVFIFMTNNDSYYKNAANPNIYRMREAMYSLSLKYQSPVWDLFEVMGGLNSIRTWERYGLAKKDKVHLTPMGYELNADLLFEAIKKSYGNYLTHQANE